MTISRELLRSKLDESLALPPRPLTRRDVRLPAIPGKAFAVIGVRRSGKTSYLAAHRSEHLHSGVPAESQLLLLLEDERLTGITVADLGWLLEEHARRVPQSYAREHVTLYLDEVQYVPGWEGLVRRLIDTGGVQVFVTGSSARLLSREVATSLRGRAMEVLIHPFSFREALRHAGAEPAPGAAPVAGPEAAELHQRLRRYLVEGGFPEAQGAEPRDRAALLAGYVDVVVLRDVIDRHSVSNPLALRWLQRQLLANPGGGFSVKKQYDTLRSQGVRVAKDTLHEYLGYLEDAFLVRTVSLHTASERRRMVNPRKAYPVDPGLISCSRAAVAATTAAPWRPPFCWNWNDAAGRFPTCARKRAGRSTSSLTVRRGADAGPSVPRDQPGCNLGAGTARPPCRGGGVPGREPLAGHA